MTAKPLKILVSGDVEGNFTQLFKRVEAIQKKNGNFDLLLCVGDFFGPNLSTWEPYKTGKVKVPISTLILGPNKEEMGIYFDSSDGIDLCDGVTFLGKQGRFTGSSGLSLAYLSGLESGSPKGELHTFVKGDARSLTSPIANDTSFKGIDVLITSQWPKGVEKYGNSVNRDKRLFPDSECISEVARILRPRYHFSGLEGIFYERSPYRNHQILLESARHTTRFIALANVANKDKFKYLYAFNIVPMSKMDPVELVAQPEGVTESPFVPSSILASDTSQESQQQFFYDMTPRQRKGQKRGGGERHDRQHHGDHTNSSQEKRPRKPPQPSGPCWFCLGSPEVEKHLVVSVSDLAYLALAKGGVVPDHVLILPVHHHQSYVSLPQEVIKQIDQYKSCLRKMFKSQDKSVVFFERNFRTQHLQIQAIPIPRDAVPDIKDAFMACAESERLELADLPKHSDLKQIVQDGIPYFYAELPTGEKCLHRIGLQFPLHFGREAVCEPAILNVPERVDWKKCQLSKEEETELSAAFKSDFRDFDFNFE